MNKKRILRLALCALMAALCYVTFTYIKISIPMPIGNTALHLGNTFCVLASLILGGLYGGVAGAVGMGIGDLLDPRYVLTTPKTIILKMGIGLVTGYFAHRVFKIRNLKDKKLVVGVGASAFMGMLFNVIMEPLFGYFYYRYILNMVEKAASTLMKFNFVTTLINALMASVVASLLYLAIHKTVVKANLLKDIS